MSASVGNETGFRDVSLEHEEQEVASPASSETPLPTTTPDIMDDGVNQKDSSQEKAADDEGEDEVQALLSELESDTLTQDEIAMEKLKSSTLKLTSVLKKVSSDIDSKLGVSNSVQAVDSKLQVSKSVKAVDTQLGVAKSVAELGSWFSQLDVQGKANAMLEQAGMKEAFDTDVQRLKNFNKEYEITSRTVGGIADGLDWIATSFPSMNDDSTVENRN